jgi:hypothetical protein
MVCSNIWILTGIKDRRLNDTQRLLKSQNQVLKDHLMLKRNSNTYTDMSPYEGKYVKEIEIIPSSKTRKFQKNK